MLVTQCSKLICTDDDHWVSFWHFWSGSCPDNASGLCLLWSLYQTMVILFKEIEHIHHTCLVVWVILILLFAFSLRICSTVFNDNYKAETTIFLLPLSSSKQDGFEYSNQPRSSQQCILFSWQAEWGKKPCAETWLAGNGNAEADLKVLLIRLKRGRGREPGGFD